MVNDQHGKLESNALRVAYFSLISSTFLVFIKITAGVLGRSYALVADGLESATDVFSTLLVIFGLRLSQQPPDENHPYGHGKVEPIITFIIVALLVVTASTIAYQAVLNMQQPQSTPETWTLAVLATIVAWKEFTYRKVLKRARDLESTSLKADAWHHRSDAISSLIALIGVGVAVVFGPGFEKADEVAAIAAAGFIYYNSYLILRPALGEVMDEHRYPELEDEVRALAMEVDGVLDTEKCFIRKIGMQYHVDLHAQVDGDQSVSYGHEIAHRIKNHVRAQIPNIMDVHIHIEPYEAS